MTDAIENHAARNFEAEGQNKVVSLFQFIRELNKLKQKPILNIHDYQWSFELSNLPDDPDNIRAFYRDRTDEDEMTSESDYDEVLLSVHKPEPKRCPEPDAIFKDWLLPGWDDFKKDVTIKETIQHLEDKKDEPQESKFNDESLQIKNPVTEYFADDEARVNAYYFWLDKRKVWLNKQRTIAKTRDLFFDLYQLYFELLRESETKEIIVANGMLCNAENSTIKHPVITHRVKLDYNADENTVYIKDVNASSDLYTIVFQAMNGINLSSINKLSETLEKNDYHPLDRIETPGYLKALVHQLSSKSTFSEDGIPENWAENSGLLLYTDPCYIVRKRLDGTLKSIEQIIENVQETGEVPAPIRDIVSGGKIKIPEDVGKTSVEEQLAAVGGESVDILLSKEANKEQLEIAKRIEYYNAVLVQGPPGTGKTHTIANLMGHFLSQGRSVLVTSYTSKALSVLKEKVAPGLQNLCVSILDDSNIDMEKSVDGITDYMSRTTSHEIKRGMENLAADRQSIISKLADVRRKIFAIINQECSSIVYNGESLSPSQAAQFIVDHEEDLSYIPGNIRLNAQIPLTFEQLMQLYRSNEGISEYDEIELENDLPSPGDLLSPEEYEQTWTGLKTAEASFANISGKSAWNISHDDKNRSITFKDESTEFTLAYPNEEDVLSLKEYIGTFGKIEKWMTCAAVDGKNGGPFRQRWETLVAQIQATCDYAESVVSEQFGINITFKDSDNISALKDAYEGLKAAFVRRNKISKLTLMLRKDFVSAIESVTINGLPPQSKKDCEIILHCIELKEVRDQCAVYWNSLLAEHGVPAFYTLDLHNQEQIAKNWIPQINHYLDWYQTDYQPLVDKLNAINVPSELIFKINTLDSDLDAAGKILNSVDGIIPEICEACLTALKVEEYASKIFRSKNFLLNGTRGNSNTCAAVLDAIDSGNAKQYAEAFSNLKKMYNKYALQYARVEMLKTLDPIAPEWANAIRNRTGIHGSFTVPSNIENAWKWKQLCGIIEDITAKPFHELQAESVLLSKEYRKTTALYAEKSGWYHLLRRTEADIDMKQALQGWKQTVKRIGKGTGKNAPALKKKARELMAKCQSAVPGWIMPINRALENLSPTQNHFDIIIIDEASQSDVSSLAILYMGKKLIIVGDDKQVSPMAVGVEIDKTSALQEMYIKDKIPNAHLYDAKTSIYDIAKTTFQPLMLREHFRCVPEIIGFSNMLSYDYQIKPLRTASSSSLLPAVVNYRVAIGRRDGRNKTNINEAKAIVALMRSCIEQPEYRGKTFGVISLLGDEQVRVIQRMIEQEIEPKEIIGRHIQCGTPANFQGDERDVVFLSIVDSGDGTGPLRMHNFGPDDAIRKRYNVAASRARDQLWVVDSLDPTTDLKSGDIRKLLIDYSINPATLDIAHAAIEKKAESPFEAAVAKKLSDRGYHLIQQWKVGAYRLDIVAVCGKKTVAIECDGERWHSGESKIREDMERQTILERLGWRFIRIRGSEYFRDPDKTIGRVIAELENFEIFPEATSTETSESRNTELLIRVKNRAGAIMEEKPSGRSIHDLTTVGAALDPKRLSPDNPSEQLSFSSVRPLTTVESLAASPKENYSKISRVAVLDAIAFQAQGEIQNAFKPKAEEEPCFVAEKRNSQSDICARRSTHIGEIKPVMPEQKEIIKKGYTELFGQTIIDNLSIEHIEKPKVSAKHNESAIKGDSIKDIFQSKHASRQEKIKKLLAERGIEYHYSNDQYGFIPYDISHKQSVRKICMENGAKSITIVRIRKEPEWRIRFENNAEDGQSAGGECNH